MTAAVKDELSRLPVVKPCCRKAESAALLRFAGAIHLIQGRIVLEAELDTAAAARRLRKDIAEVYGHTSELGGRSANSEDQRQRHSLLAGFVRHVRLATEFQSRRLSLAKPVHHSRHHQRNESGHAANDLRPQPVPVDAAIRTQS